MQTIFKNLWDYKQYIMTTVKAWLEGIMFESALNPQPRDNWPTAPASYVQASQEAAQTLNS